LKKIWLVVLIVIIVLGLLIGGLVFALSPSFPLVVPRQSEYEDLGPALNAYLMEKVADALDDYPGEGDMEIVLDQAGLSQVFADALSRELDLPRSIRYTGVFMNVRQEYIQVGSGFKFLIFPVGVSARLQVEVHEGNLHLAIKSAHLGRIPLPIDPVLKFARQFVNLPEEITAFSLALNEGGDSPDLSISGLELQDKQLVFKVQVDEGPFAAIDEGILEELEKVQPQAEAILEDNPRALEILGEIETLIEEAKAGGKDVNPVRVRLLGEEFFNSLSEKELRQLEDIVDEDTMHFFREEMDWSPLP
jgi:hypothetical protein